MIACMDWETGDLNSSSDSEITVPLRNYKSPSTFLNMFFGPIKYPLSVLLIGKPCEL